MKAIIFDFGGTLDTDGTHWGIKFHEVYLSSGIMIPEKVFRNAYVLAERDMAGKLKKNTGLLETLNKQISFQLKHLVNDYNCRFYDDLPQIADDLSWKCYSEVKNNTGYIYNTLLNLSKKYTLGVISNFYGNLIQVLKDLGIYELFSLVMDSELIGIRKPDREFYHEMLGKTALKPEELIMIGDSYDNDIVPSKSLGCRTIWLKGRAWKYPEDYSMADFIIGSLSEVESAVEIMEKMTSPKSLSPYAK
ncbi:MAG: HAD family hydrolase [Bacteroidota bacterium]|jgi:putative hydrolase of the HAD superfamily|nr:HAD family hydrolase [Ignavibacteria bacterium]MCU7510975.1 HAD family hydrolase [Ignavibacteria bacterium]MCU7523202.1 HAD family hydrolase [Ignavibacteria bacterium]